jgi:hypothetical protein
LNKNIGETQFKSSNDVIAIEKLGTMTTQQVTIELPEPIFRQLVRIAEATHQPVEALVTQSVISNLPPFTENAPTDIQPELLRMQTVDKDELKAIAYAQIEPGDRERHVNLLKKNEEDLLTAEDLLVSLGETKPHRLNEGMNIDQLKKIDLVWYSEHPIAEI